MASYFWISTASTDPTAGANWQKSDGTTGTAPGNGDDAFITPVNGVTLSGIGYADMSSVTLNSLTISANITIGTNTTSSSDYYGFWKIGATTATISTADGTPSTGSGRILLNLGTSQATVTVLQTTNTPLEANAAPVRLLLSNSSSVVNVLAGTVGIATNLPTDTSTLSAMNASGNTAFLEAGPGTTWTTATASNGGTLYTDSGGTTLSIGPSSFGTTGGGAAITTINNSGTGTFNHRISGGGTICTTLNNYNQAVSNFSQNPATGTVTTINRYPVSTVKVNAANPGHITFTTRNSIQAGTEQVSA